MNFPIVKWSLLGIVFWNSLFLVESDRRIIAGRDAVPEEFPFHAALEKNNAHWCGGSILNEFYVLTASHCVYAVRKLAPPIPRHKLRVRVGHVMSLTGGTIYSIHFVILHEKYDGMARIDRFDVGLVKTVRPIKFSEKVQPINLLPRAPLVGEKGVVCGFGRQDVMRRSEEQIRHFKAVVVPVIPLKECKRKLLAVGPQAVVSDDMICAGGRFGRNDACSGDSGGPLVTAEGQIGIVAWGLGCGRIGIPGVYTNVARYIDWINSHMVYF